MLVASSALEVVCTPHFPIAATPMTMPLTLTSPPFHHATRAGKYSVPVLWDKKQRTIVNNEVCSSAARTRCNVLQRTCFLLTESTPVRACANMLVVVGTVLQRWSAGSPPCTMNVKHHIRKSTPNDNSPCARPVQSPEIMRIFNSAFNEFAKNPGKQDTVRPGPGATEGHTGVLLSAQQQPPPCCIFGHAPGVCWCAQLQSAASPHPTGPRARRHGPAPTHALPLCYSYCIRFSPHPPPPPPHPCTRADVDVYPEALRPAIDEVSSWVQPGVNMAVYGCGFAPDQKAYEQACQVGGQQRIHSIST